VDSEAKAERDRFRAYAPELGLLLWAVWDPIGAEVPLDEYEAYVPTVWRLLSEHADVEAIATCLDTIADERMGEHRGAGARHGGDSEPMVVLAFRLSC
jgi:hypothetical protein